MVIINYVMIAKVGNYGRVATVVCRQIVDDTLQFCCCVWLRVLGLCLWGGGGSSSVVKLLGVRVQSGLYCRLIVVSGL